MSELTEKVELAQMLLMSVIKDWSSHLYVVQDGDRIIESATLCIFQSPTGTKASIEDVVVSSTYRGQHLGKQLVEHILQEAKRFAPITAPNLQSQPHSRQPSISIPRISEERDK